MNWTESSTKYQAELRSALDLHRHAKSLCDLSGAGVSQKLIDELGAQVPVAKRQLERLEKNEFRIAVVGLEKAGKSTFVNAWLGCDLLPTAQARCTYTPTQIFAVTDEREQRLVVVPKSGDDFRSLLEELEKSQLREAKADLDTIQKNRGTLDQVLREGEQRVPFTTLEEIRPLLTKYVADKRFAHAIKEARLYTTQLAAIDGVVFYDVPGMDSGLSKTIEDNKQMLEDCDAIIIVMDNPDLRGSEKELINLAVAGDTIPIAEKLFIFLGRADQRPTAASWQQRQDKAKTSWRDIGQTINEKRFLAGSAGAYMLLAVPNLTLQTRQDLGSPDVAVQALATACGCQATRDDALLATKIAAFKQAVSDYLQNDRVGLLAQRCDGVIRQIRESAEVIYADVRKRVPEDPEELRQHGEFIKTDAFSKWWGEDNSGKWMEVRGNLLDFRDKNILKMSHSGIPVVAFLEVWMNAYKNDIATRIQNLPSRNEKARTDIFRATANPAFVPSNANHAWREKLYQEVLEAIQEAAGSLASNLNKMIFQVRNHVQQLLWGSPKVDHVMSGSLALDQAYLENALKILFLRFARPIADVLIRAALGSQMRANRITGLSADIEAMNSYLVDRKEIDSAFRQPKLYGEFGFALLSDKSIREQQIGEPKVLMPASAPAKALMDGKFTGNENLQGENQVIREVEGDLVGLEVILSEGLFEASGFAGFSYAEMQSLVDHFLARASQWRGLAEHEWRIGNPRLIAELPPELKTVEVDIEVSARLANLREALTR
jgi:GTPase SAR1 family protein